MSADSQPTGEFVGRDVELVRLLASLASASSGRGSLFLIGGEPGIGKSRLADEFAARARRDGVQVLWGRCWEGAGAPPYWAWIQALRGFLRDADPVEVRSLLGAGAADVAQMLPEIRTLIADLPQAPPDSDSARFQLFNSTVTFMRNFARVTPTVMILDDLHAADTPSILLLRFLATQLSSMRLVVVGTYRDLVITPDHPLAPALTEMAREPITQLISLRGLHEAGVAEFIRTATGHEAAERIARAMWRETSGNPLFLGEALRLLQSERRLDDVAKGTSLRLSVPAGVREVITRRLAQLSQATVRLLTIGAALGPEFSVDAVRHISGEDSNSALEMIGEAMKAGLVLPVAASAGQFRFSHDLVRESLVGDQMAGARVELHRRVAEALEEMYGAEDEAHQAELAYHYFEAAEGGSGSENRAIAEKAQRFAEQAGNVATSALAYEEADRFFRMSLAALDRGGAPDPLVRTRLLLDIGEVDSRSGDLDSAQRAYLEVVELTRRSGDVRNLARAVLGYGGRVGWARPGADTRLIPLLHEALALLGGADDRLRVRLMTRLACAFRSSPDKREQSDSLSREAVETARRLDDPATLGYALVGRYYAVLWPENADQRIDLATETVEVANAAGDAELLVDGHLLLWLSDTEHGRKPDARSSLDDVSRLALELRQPAQMWLGIGPRALVALMEGDFDLAERLIQEQMEVSQPLSAVRDNVSAARMHAFLLAHERDQLVTVEPEVRLAVDEFPWYPLHRAALAILLLETGRREEAKRVFAALADNAFAALYRDNEWLLGMSLASYCCSKLHDAAAAADLYEQLVPFAGRHAIGHAEGSVGIVDRYLGLLAVVLDQIEPAIEHLRRAVDLNAAIGARPWAAHSQRDLAMALRRRGSVADLEEAVTLEQSALSTARLLGMTRLERELSLPGDVEATRPPTEQAAESKGLFRRDGEYWTIEFGGDQFRIRDAKGLRYIGRLIAAPGREMLALDLARDADGSPSKIVGYDDALVADDGGGAGPRLDPDAKEAYRSRVQELRLEIEQANEWNDPERAASAQRELDFIARELSAAVGLGGRDRPAASASERARISVTRAIRLAMAKIAENNVSLGAHFEATIHTGTYCAYRPDPRVPIVWQD